MATLFMHHYYVPKSDWGYTYLTNFHEEFDKADHIGTEAILETYNRLFNEWKDNSVYIKDIRKILNHRCTFWGFTASEEPNNKKYAEYGLTYLKLYEKLDRFIYGSYFAQDTLSIIQ